MNALEILTLDVTGFQRLYADFQQSVVSKYTIVEALRNVSRPLLCATHPELKYALLTQLDTFYRGEVDEATFFNAQLTIYQANAVGNVITDDFAPDGCVFSFVRDGKLFRDYTMVMCYVMWDNEQITRYLECFSEIDCAFVFQSAGQVAGYIKSNLAFCSQQALYCAYNAHDLRFIEARLKEEHEDAVSRLLLTEDVANTEINYMVRYFLEPTTRFYPLFAPFDAGLYEYRKHVHCEIQPYDKQNPYTTCGFFILKEQLPDASRFQSPSYPFFNAAFNNDLYAMKKHMRYCIHTKEAGLSAIHYAIIGNAGRCLQELLSEEKYSKTGEFWLYIDVCTGILIPEGSTCLWLSRALGRSDFCYYFTEFRPVYCQDWLPGDFLVMRGYQIGDKIDQQNAAHYFKTALHFYNLSALVQVLQSSMISPAQLQRRCRYIVADSSRSLLDCEILSFMKLETMGNAIPEELRYEIDGLPELQLDNSGFKNYFGVLLGRYQHFVTGSFAQRKEISAFFDACIQGTVQQADLDLYIDMVDQRPADGTVVTGFTGMHYVTLYYHSRKYTLYNTKSGVNTVLRLRNYDILFENGLMVEYCACLTDNYAFSMLEFSTNAGRIYLNLEAFNIHFMALSQQDAQRIIQALKQNAVNEYIIASLLEEKEGVRFDYIFYNNSQNGKLYHQLLVSALAHEHEDISAHYGYQTLTEHPENYNYVLPDGAIEAPKVFRFGCDNKFFDKCKRGKLSSQDLISIYYIERQASDFYSYTYHGMNGLFYAVLCGNLENVKVLLPLMHETDNQQALIIYRRDGSAVFVPYGSRALHFAVLTKSELLEYIVSFYQQRESSYSISYVALCVSQRIPYSKALFYAESKKFRFLYYIIRQMAVIDDAEAIENVLASADRDAVIAAVTNKYDADYLLFSMTGKAYNTIRLFVNTYLVASAFHERFAPMFGCYDRYELLALYDTYVKGESEYDFGSNSNIYNWLYSQCCSDDQFTYETFACKGKYDTRPTSGDVINGFTGLLYCILHDYNQKALQLFKHEGSMPLLRECCLCNTTIKPGTSPLKVCLLLSKFELLEKLCKAYYDVARAEVIKDGDFIGILIEKDQFSQLIVQFYVDGASEAEIIELIKKNSKTKIGQHFMYKLSANSAFYTIVLESDEFSAYEKQVAKSLLFKCDKQLFCKKFGETELQVFYTAQRAQKQRELTIKSAHSTNYMAAEMKLDAAKMYAEATWFEYCKNTKIKGVERTVGSVDVRPTDAANGVFHGFSGLFYAIMYKNYANIATLSKKEHQLKLTSAEQLRIDGRIVELPCGTSPVQFALIYGLEGYFTEVTAIPPESGMFYLYGGRQPPGFLTCSELEYCKAANLPKIYYEALRRAENGDREQMIALLKSNVQRDDVDFAMSVYYSDKAVAYAFAERFGAAEFEQMDMAYHKSLAAGATTSQSQTLFKAIIERDFAEVRRLFFAEYHNRTAVDAVIAEHFVSRGSTPFHVLPFTTLEIVQWVILRDDCQPSFECNRFLDTFLDIALQVNSNASLLLLYRFGTKYCETNFVRVAKQILHFENRQLLDLLIKYAKKHDNSPYEILFGEDFDEKGRFQTIIMDAFKCQALCQLLAAGKVQLSDVMTRQINRGVLEFRKGQFVVEEQEEEEQLDYEDYPEDESQGAPEEEEGPKAKYEFAGFSAISSLMCEKWRRVGRLVMGTEPLGEDDEVTQPTLY